MGVKRTPTAFSPRSGELLWPTARVCGMRILFRVHNFVRTGGGLVRRPWCEDYTEKCEVNDDETISYVLRNGATSDQTKRSQNITIILLLNHALIKQKRNK